MHDRKTHEHHNTYTRHTTPHTPHTDHTCTHIHTYTQHTRESLLHQEVPNELLSDCVIHKKSGWLEKQTRTGANHDWCVVVNVVVCLCDLFIGISCVLCVCVVCCVLCVVCCVLCVVCCVFYFVCCFVCCVVCCVFCKCIDSY